MSLNCFLFGFSLCEIVVSQLLLLSYDARPAISFMMRGWLSGFLLFSLLI